MTMPTSGTALQATSIVPSLTVNDLQLSITFYEGLGFAIEERWEDAGVLLGVMLRAGDSRIGLGQDDWKKGRDRVKGAGMRILIGTEQNIDDLAACVQAAGITLDAEPHDTPWGSRAIEITDPSGFKLTISTD
ncbi:MAG TPA: VOC family protein [Vicinamibacterales bacterium]|nr:VOC family protein [Vicinamibacterales bacterium]